MRTPAYVFCGRVARSRCSFSHAVGQTYRVDRSLRFVKLLTRAYRRSNRAMHPVGLSPTRCQVTVRWSPMPRSVSSGRKQVLTMRPVCCGRSKGLSGELSAQRRSKSRESQRPIHQGLRRHQGQEAGGCRRAPAQRRSGISAICGCLGFIGPGPGIRREDWGSPKRVVTVDHR